MNKALLITEDSAYFKRGELLESYDPVDDGVVCDGKFINENQFLVIEDGMSSSAEKKVRNIIREQVENLFFKLHNNK